jgi:hypothetical protein
MEKAEAAKRLGVPESEVAAVREVTAVGTVATTTDGREYVITDNGNLAFYGDAPKHTTFPVVERVDEAELFDDPPGPGVDTDGDGVPEGNVEQIMFWVGDGQDDAERRHRAIAAYNVEVDRGEAARKTLLAALEKVAGEFDRPAS